MDSKLISWLFETFEKWSWGANCISGLLLILIRSFKLRRGNGIRNANFHLRYTSGTQSMFSGVSGLLPVLDSKLIPRKFEIFGKWRLQTKFHPIKRVKSRNLRRQGHDWFQFAMKFWSEIYPYHGPHGIEKHKVYNRWCSKNRIFTITFHADEIQKKVFEVFDEVMKIRLYFYLGWIPRNFKILFPGFWLIHPIYEFHQLSENSRWWLL